MKLFTKFNYHYALILLVVTCLFFYSYKNSRNSITIDLQPYKNSYTTDETEFSLGDSIIRIPMLNKDESYMYKNVDFSLKDLSNMSLNPIMPIIKIKLKAGDIVDDQNKFKIGIIDMNNNGVFNEKFIDQFFIAPYQSGSTLIENTNPWIDTLKNINVFSVNDIYYELNNVDSKGINLTINKDVKPKLTKDIKIKAITNINRLFELTDLENKPIKSTELFNNRPLYLEFWFNGCSGCVKSFKYLQAKKIKDFDLVGVNAIDNISVIDSFNSYFGFNFDHYQIKESVMKRIGNMGEYPSAIKYDENGLLVDQFYHFPYIDN